MSIDRQEAITHFEAIRCGGAMEEAEIRPDLSCMALKPDHSYMVLATPLVDEPLFEEAIGAVNIQNIIRGLKAHSDGTQDGEVELDHDPQMGQLVISTEGGEDEIRVNLVELEVIGTRATEEAESIVLTSAAEGNGQHLPEYKGRRLKNTKTMTDSSKALIKVTTTDVKVRFGDPRTNVGTVTIPEIQGEEQYEIMINADHLVRVLNQIEYEDAEFILTGDEGDILVMDGNFIYALGQING